MRREPVMSGLDRDEATKQTATRIADHMLTSGQTLEFLVRNGAWRLEDDFRGTRVAPAPPNIIAGFLGIGPEDEELQHWSMRPPWRYHGQ
jgi:hypothetical protein